MAGHPKIGSFLLFQEEENTPIFRSVRAGELDGNKITQHVRLDQFHAELSGDRTFFDQLMANSMVTVKLSHPNILRKIKSFHDNGSLVSAYEYVEGFSLQQVLDRSRSEGFPFSIDHALLVASKISSALGYVHSQKMTHGFLNPSYVFITNEGEVRLKGFASSSALRAVLAAHTSIAEQFKHYIPEAAHAGNGDHARFDVFATGAILFEMLTGEPFYGAGRNVNVKDRVTQTPTASEGEPIPPKIAKILISAIDPQAPDAYKSVQAMVQEMEALIFSGEYSPTTFNLAFFMHSAFRSEIEEFATRISEEKTKNFTDGGPQVGGSMPSLPTAPRAAAPPPVKQAAPAQVAPPSMPSAPSSPMPQPAKKSSMPMILAIVAVLLLGGGAAWFFLLRDKGPAIDENLLAQQADLERLREEELAKEEQMRVELMEAEIEALKLQLEDQQTDDKDKEAENLQAQLKETELQIQLAKEEQQKLALQRQIAEREEEIERMKTERIKQQEIEKKRQQQLAASKKAEQDKAAQAQAEEEKAAQANTAQPEIEPAIEVEEKAQPEPIATKPEPKAVETSNPEPVPSAPVKPEPPEEGDLVELSEWVNVPQLADRPRILEIPPKAVRAGHFKPGETKLFLLEVLVTEKGKVEDVRIKRSPFAAGMDDFGMREQATKYAKRLKWTPGEMMGVKVRVWTILGVHFKAF